MTTRTNSGIPDDDEDDYDDEVQAAPQPPVVHELQQGVNILRHGIAGVSQYESMASSSLSTVSAASHIRAFEQIRADAGVAGNPIEQILVDGAMLAHIQAARLISKAEGQSPQVAEIYHKASAKYLSESRKQALALREYRSPVVAKQVTVYQQQNVAAGDQRISSVVADTRQLTHDMEGFAAQLATVCADTTAPVSRVEHKPSAKAKAKAKAKVNALTSALALASAPASATDLIFESFIATDEVREHFAKLDAEEAQRLKAKELRNTHMHDDEVCCVFGTRNDFIGV